METIAYNSADFVVDDEQMVIPGLKIRLGVDEQPINELNPEAIPSFLNAAIIIPEIPIWSGQVT